MFGSYLTRYNKKKEHLDINTMNFPIKCDIGGNPTLQVQSEVKLSLFSSLLIVENLFSHYEVLQAGGRNGWILLWRSQVVCYEGGDDHLVVEGQDRRQQGGEGSLLFDPRHP